RQGAHHFGLEGAWREDHHEIGRGSPRGGLSQAVHAEADPYATCCGRAAATAQEGDFPAQNALRSPRGAESTPYRGARKRPGGRIRFLPPLPGVVFPQGVQAGRHAVAYRLQVLAQPLHTRKVVSRYWSEHVSGLTPYTPGE